MYEVKYDFDFNGGMARTVEIQIYGDSPYNYGEKLISSADKILETQFDNVEALYSKAEGLFLKKKYGEVITICDKISELNVDSPKTGFASSLRIGAMGAKRYLEKHPEEK